MSASHEWDDLEAALLRLRAARKRGERWSQSFPNCAVEVQWTDLATLFKWIDNRLGEIKPPQENQV